MNREEAAKNARKKLLEKYEGDEEALKEAQRERGRAIGRSNKGKKVGFAADPDKARMAGRLSGHIRRIKKRNKR